MEARMEGGVVGRHLGEFANAARQDKPVLQSQLDQLARVAANIGSTLEAIENAVNRLTVPTPKVAEDSRTQGSVNQAAPTIEHQLGALLSELQIRAAHASQLLQRLNRAV